MNNFFKVVFHAIVMGVLFVLPTLFAAHPAWLDITVGSLLNGIYLRLMSTTWANTGVAFKKKY